MKKTAILGGGVLGSAISNIVGQNNCKVAVYSNDVESLREINEKHTNTKYTKYPINENVVAFDDLAKAVDGADYIFIILPSKVIGVVLEELKKINVNFTQKFVIFSKGIDDGSGKFFSELMLDFFPKSEVAVLSGPNFAEEILEKKMTVTTVATKNIMFFNELEKVLNCDYFRIKYFDDLKAVQLSGLVKNVLAILCGISEGLNLGKNTFAAIMLRGIEEISDLCLRYGYNDRVINTPAGIGDIILTCGSQKSRNMCFGFRIGSGEKVSEIIKSLNSTVEGLVNAKNLEKISGDVGLNSIASAVIDIAQNDYSGEELITVITNKIFKQNETKY
jgi:glycerol-3-phosphate dehydrogenase (NAD(P)+)